MGAANARRAIGQGTGFGFGQSDQFAQVVGRCFRVHRQIQGRARRQRDGHKVALVVVTQRLADQGVDGKSRPIGHHEGVAVFGGQGHGLCRHHAIRTGPVVDRDRLAQTLTQALGVNARHRVGQTACGMGDDEFDGLVRVGLGPGVAGHAHGRSHGPTPQKPKLET